MATNVELDEALINEAQKLGHHSSKRATIEEALREYVQHRKQMEIKEMFGKVVYEESVKYKALRKRK